MRNLGKVLFLVAAIFLSKAVLAGDVGDDSRIRTIIYGKNDVFKMTTSYGYQSSIEFDAEEKFRTISLGNSAAFKITPAGNRIFVRAVQNDQFTNMTVVTDKRTYQFELSSILEDEKDIVYVVRFYYPDKFAEEQGELPGQPMIPQQAAQQAQPMAPISAALPQIQQAPVQQAPQQFGAVEAGFEAPIIPEENQNMQVAPYQEQSFEAPQGGFAPTKSNVEKAKYGTAGKIPASLKNKQLGVGQSLDEQAQFKGIQTTQQYANFSDQPAYNAPVQNSAVIAPIAADYANKPASFTKPNPMTLETAVQTPEVVQQPAPQPLTLNFPDAPHGKMTSNMPAIQMESPQISQDTGGAVPSTGGKNLNYTMSGPQNLSPSETYDDGKKVFFKFAPNTFPTSFFSVDKSGIEKPLQFKNENGYFVVEQVVPQMTVYFGQQKIFVFNEAMISNKAQ